MKTFLNLMLFFCVSPILFAQYFQPSSNSSHLTSNFRNDGRIILGDDYSSSYRFQIYKNSLTNLSMLFGNSQGRLEIGVAADYGAYSPWAVPGDIVFRRLSSNQNLLFVMNQGNLYGAAPTYNTHAIKFTDSQNNNSLVIFNNGKVSIGTGNFDATDYRLYVKNGIKTEKVKVEVASSNGWADYVFKKDYNLLSLEEVKSFIDENGHLPNMPSAQQIVDDGGFELKEMNVKLLEKIEELTLYIIQQNEEIGKLKESIEDIKSNSN